MIRTVPVTLLLVDDEPAHARLFERTLRRGGIRNRIVHIGTGAEALELLFTKARHTESGPPEPVLLILDLNMPGLGSYQVLERLKSDERTRHLPVIVLTTTQDRQVVVRCRDLGCDSFLSKPVDQRQFREATKRLGLVLDRATEVTTGGAHEFFRICKNFIH